MRDAARKKILKRELKNGSRKWSSILWNNSCERSRIAPGGPRTKANSYYINNFLALFGHMEELKVPRVHEKDFHPKISPYRHRAPRSFLKPSWLSTLWSEHLGHLPVPGGRLRRFLLTPECLPAHSSRRTCPVLAGGAPSRRVLLDIHGRGHSFLSVEGRPPRSQCTSPWASS